MKIPRKTRAPEDAEEEHPVLIGRRHPEVGEHHDEDEDVVDGQRVLDHVPGQELERGLPGGQQGVEAGHGHEPSVEREVPPHVEEEGQVEEEREGHPDDAPGGGLPDRDRVGLAVEDPQVQGEQDEDEEQEAQVEGPVLAEREEAHGGIHRCTRNGEFTRRPAFPLDARGRALLAFRLASRAAFPSLSRKGDVPMTLRTTVLPLGFGLSALLCAPAARPGRGPARAPRAPGLHQRGPRPGPPRSGTRRASTRSPPRRPRRARPRPPRGAPPGGRARTTGGARPPACASGCAATGGAGGRAACADRRARPGAGPSPDRAAAGSGSGSGSEATLRAKLEALERRMRQAEDDLLDRARRDGALPGWLR